MDITGRRKVSVASVAVLTTKKGEQKIMTYLEELDNVNRKIDELYLNIQISEFYLEQLKTDMTALEAVKSDLLYEEVNKRKENKKSWQKKRN